MAGDQQADVVDNRTTTASVRVPDRAASPGLILDICDRVLEEVGRRGHLFAWLRSPGAAIGEWLPVDAYYPSRRVVVICRQAPDEHDGLFAELIPAHGLRLLRVIPGELGDEPERRLRDEVARLELPPRYVEAQAGTAAAYPRESAMARMGASLAQATAPPVRERPRPGRRAAQVQAQTQAQTPSVALGVAIGIALAVVIAVEMIVGVEQVALGGAHWLLAFGFALDGCARVLGTVAAARAARMDWAWWSVLVGSPAVATFTLFAREGRMTTEPAPIAGLIAVIALLAIGLALIGALIGV